MKLVAMVMVGPGEEDRYLAPFFDHLLGFCDEIRVRWETTEPGLQFTRFQERAQILSRPPTFFEHEGRARQELLDWTMEGQPTHVLAIDADEFIADGQKLREAMQQPSAAGVWRLEMTEIWGATEDHLNVRWDGMWKPRPCGIAFEVPPDRFSNRQKRRHWHMPDSALACGRVPILVAAGSNRTTSPPVTQILHFGWACKADRAARHQRYVQHDGGRFHQNKHLDSIMWGDERVEVRPIAWPATLDRETLLARVNRT